MELSDDLKAEARMLARVFFDQVNPRTLPTYSWLQRNSEVAKALPHNVLPFFGRVVIDTCKQLQQSRSPWRR